MALFSDFSPPLSPKSPLTLSLLNSPAKTPLKNQIVSPQVHRRLFDVSSVQKPNGPSPDAKRHSSHSASALSAVSSASAFVYTSPSSSSASAAAASSSLSLASVAWLTREHRASTLALSAQRHTCLAMAQLLHACDDRLAALMGDMATVFGAGSADKDVDVDESGAEGGGSNPALPPWPSQPWLAAEVFFTLDVFSFLCGV